MTDLLYLSILTVVFVCRYSLSGAGGKPWPTSFEAMGRAFSPLVLWWWSLTQADGPGWYRARLWRFSEKEEVSRCWVADMGQPGIGPERNHDNRALKCIDQGVDFLRKSIL